MSVDNSDSDDTDILLLIPPSYYITNAEKVLKGVDEPDIQDSANIRHKLQRTEDNEYEEHKEIKEQNKQVQEEKDNEKENKDDVLVPATDKAAQDQRNLNQLKSKLFGSTDQLSERYNKQTSAKLACNSNPYDVLIHDCRNTLEEINCRNTLPEINCRRHDWSSRQVLSTCSFENISDISSVSGCPVDHHQGCTDIQPQRRHESLPLHSTPKSYRSELNDNDDNDNDNGEDDSDQSLINREQQSARINRDITDSTLMLDRQLTSQEQNAGNSLGNCTDNDRKSSSNRKDTTANESHCKLSNAKDIDISFCHCSVDHVNVSGYERNDSISIESIQDTIIMPATKFTLNSNDSNSNPRKRQNSNLNHQTPHLHPPNRQHHQSQLHHHQQRHQHNQEPSKLLKHPNNHEKDNGFQNSINTEDCGHGHGHGYGDGRGDGHDVGHVNHSNNDETERKGVNTPTFTNGSMTEEQMSRYVVATTNTPVDYFARYSCHYNENGDKSSHINNKDSNTKTNANAMLCMEPCNGHFKGMENECKRGSLISLSKIWTTVKEPIINNNNNNNNINTNNPTITTNASVLMGCPGATIQEEHHLMEEQLRRQHLEKTVRELQSRLLEYQQRISVAMEVDKSKDEALETIQRDKSSLFEDLQQTRQQLQNVEERSKRIDERLSHSQKELSQAIALSAKFQDKIERLELESTQNSNKYRDACHQYKQEIDELNIKLEACKSSEESIINEMQKLKDKYAKSQHLYEKTKVRNDELQKENATLKHQKEALTDYHQKQKTRADHLESQKESLQDSVAHLTQIEASLKKKLELQQKSLKNHYQVQLENVVTQKHKEFQEQFEKHECQLRLDSKERERLIADRAVKQIELITEKNNLEIQLLQEKHDEERELYRIQMENATKTIQQLEYKLQLMKTKRADIAEKLHNVMEVQWQKALEILTSPNQTLGGTIGGTTIDLNRNDNDSLDTNECSTYKKCMRNDNYSTLINNYSNTPKSNKKQNNLNVENNKGVVSPVDKLQAYIELLLDKSPGDLDRFDDILTLSTKIKQAKEKLEKNARKQNGGGRLIKPPWKG